MDKNETIEVYVNPLAFLKVDAPWAKILKEDVDYESIVKFMLTPGIGQDVEAIIKRYKKISTEPLRLNAAPLEDNVLLKLVWPLRHAKACYMMGNYLSVIALCGMVAEMVSILWFDMSKVKINKNKMTDKAQENLFGSKFEKLGQKRRVNVLSAYGLISKEIKDKFDIIRTKRRKYLHFYSHSHSKIESDSVEVYQATAFLVVTVIGQDIDDKGRLLLNPLFKEYLIDKGLIEKR